MSLLVQYKSGATMTYHLTAYSPWEGYHVMFNGSRGRLELNVCESEYRIPSTGEGLLHGASPLPNVGPTSITLHPLWEKPVTLDVEVDHGGLHPVEPVGGVPGGPEEAGRHHEGDEDQADQGPESDAAAAGGTFERVHR